MAWKRGEIGEEEIAARTLLRTRQYVRRQRTWFRREPGFRWFRLGAEPLASLPAIAEYAESELRALGWKPRP
jgi:tRNA dimethylallyltransferase